MGVQMKFNKILFFLIILYLCLPIIVYAESLNIKIAVLNFKNCSEEEDGNY
jgi:hypothetical protein